MTITKIEFMCNYCFNIINDGYTICYQPNASFNIFRIGRVREGLMGLRSKIKTDGLLVAHICRACANGIHHEVERMKFIGRD